MTTEYKPIDKYTRFKKQNTTLKNEVIEQRILSSILSNDNVLIDCLDIISPEMFAFDINRQIYEAMMTLFKNESSVKEDFIIEKLSDSFAVDEDKESYVRSLKGLVAGSKLGVSYSKLLRERHVEAKIASLPDEITEIISKSGKDIEDIKKDILSLVIKQTNEQRQSEAPEFSINADSFCADLEKSLDSEVDFGFKTGFPNLDDTIQNLQPGRLYYVIASSKAGKSTITDDFALNIAKEYPDHQVNIYSLEMSKEEKMLGFIAKELKLDKKYITHPKMYFKRFGKDGKLVDDDTPENRKKYFDLVKGAIERLNKLNINIIDNQFITAQEMYADVQKTLLQKGKMSLVIVDTIELMTRGDNPYNKMLEASAMCKNISKVAKCPVIAVHQYNNTVKDKPDRRGDIFCAKNGTPCANDADAIIALFRGEIFQDSWANDNPELAKECDITIQLCRYANTSDNSKIPLKFHGYGFSEA